MNGQLFTVKCLTNLHVGNGDINFSVIDNEVQRDAVTNYPCIYASSLKGALRDYFEENNIGNIVNIFGSDSKSSNESADKNKSIQGQVKFMQANVLFLPVRASSGSYPYYYVTTKEMLEQYARYCSLIGTANDKLNEDLKKIDETKCYVLADEKDKPGIDFLETTDLAVLKDVLVDLLKSFEIDSKKVLILSDDKFKFINLPVVARNKLDEKGISQNLWYEELVPHESVFYFAALSTGPDSSDKVLGSFSEKFVEKQYVQFGGNASVGNGICELKKA